RAALHSPRRRVSGLHTRRPRRSRSPDKTVSRAGCPVFPAVSVSQYRGHMKSGALFAGVVILCLLGASGAAQSPVSVPLKEWTIPFAVAPHTARVDRHGDVWTTGVGRFAVEGLDGAGITTFFPSALVRLNPPTNAFTYC